MPFMQVRLDWVFLTGFSRRVQSKGKAIVLHLASCGCMCEETTLMLACKPILSSRPYDSCGSWDPRIPHGWHWWMQRNKFREEIGGHTHDVDFASILGVLITRMIFAIEEPILPSAAKQVNPAAEREEDVSQIC